MSRDSAHRERRAVALFGLLAIALILAGVASAMLFTAGEPRRGDGMIPPPVEESQEVPEPGDAENDPSEE